MSFARPRNTPTGCVTTQMQRHMDRQIEERCAGRAAEQLEAIKKSAAPKQRVDPSAWDRHEATLKANAKLYTAKVREAEENLRQQSKEANSRLREVDARTDLALRLSVTERGNRLAEETYQKRHTEAARHARNKRTLAKLVQKAKPRTEVVLSSDVHEKLNALDHEKRSLHRAELSEIKAANKQASQRLRDAAARVFDAGDGGDEAGSGFAGRAVQDFDAGDGVDGENVRRDADAANTE